MQYIDHKIGCSIDYVFGLHLTTFYVFFPLQVQYNQDKYDAMTCIRTNKNPKY